MVSRLAEILMPQWKGAGTERSIGEQILADALGAQPSPRTPQELALILHRDYSQRGSVAMALIAALRLLIAEQPHATLDGLRHRIIRTPDP